MPLGPKKIQTRTYESGMISKYIINITPFSEMCLLSDFVLGHNWTLVEIFYGDFVSMGNIL